MAERIARAVTETRAQVRPLYERLVMSAARMEG
jgi:hypothetical protein